jgi:hypothetical protein
VYHHGETFVFRVAGFIAMVNMLYDNGDLEYGINKIKKQVGTVLAVREGILALGKGNNETLHIMGSLRCWSEF